MLIVGGIPENGKIGGVTIHVKRLTEGLKQLEYPFTVLDYKKVPFSKQLKLFIRNKAAHLHVSNPLLKVFYIVLGMITRTKIVMTIHGNLGQYKAFKNFLNKIAVKYCDIPVLINDKSYKKAIKWNKNARFIPAFIPPLNETELPDNIKSIVSKYKQDGKKIVATNASSHAFNAFGDEIYGIDFLINFFSKKPEYVLLISDASGQYKEYYQTTPENVQIISERHSFYKLILESDMVIRNTVTDGDSLSVKEALYAGKSMFVTDVVDRPAGTILFHYNDSKSLIDAMENSKGKEMTSEFDNRCVEQLSAIYSELEKINLKNKLSDK